MRIFAIDDEPNMLRLLHEAIAQAAPEAEITDFHLGSDAISFIADNWSYPDVIFSDIRMPGLTGLELAVRLKELSPNTKLVFVSAFDYALDSYRLHVGGYILKPVDAQRVREELDNLFPQYANPPKKLRVQCFGSFEVFFDDSPLWFARKQSKEVFAYLVDRRGVSCTADEIIATIWEDVEDMPAAKQRLRNLVSDLKATLKAVGMSDALIRQGSRLAVQPKLLDCDYYRMLEGDVSAVNAFRGEYMEQYSWAEITKGGLTFL